MNLDRWLQPEQISAYLARLKAKGASEKTLKRKEAALKKFVSWYQSQYGWQPASFPSTTPRSSVSLKTILRRSSSLYHPLSFTSYFVFSLIVILCSALGFAFYQQIFRQAKPELAYPTTLNPPARILSFQGRLTDSAGTPIETAIDFVFRLYDAETEGNVLWTSNTCSIDPDQDGIFSVRLGATAGADACGPAILSSVFSENIGVWLEVQVDDQTLTPRQPIATAAYALNAETLQGYPASASAVENTVPIMDNNGDIVLGAASPTIESTSGNFAIKGQVLTLQTPDTSNGSVIINPDGTGVLDLIFEGSSPGGSSQGFVNATNANLASGSLYYGGVDNVGAASYNLLTLQSSADSPSLKTQFSVSAAGDIFANRAATISGSLKVDENTLYIDAAQNRVGVGTTSPGQKLTVEGTLGILEGGSSPTYHTIFQGGDQSAEITYTLPTSQGASSTFLKNDGSGNLSWSIIDSSSITPDSLDFTEFQDTLDLDANLTLNQSTYTWTQNFDGTTQTGLTYNANSLTSGKGVYLLSTATGLTGNLAEVVLSGSNAANTGNVLRVAQTGALSAAVPLMVTNLGTGLSFRVNDETGDNDSTPFVIDASGNVGIGTTNPTYKLDVTGTGRFTSTLNVESTSNPGLTVGNGTTGYLKVGGSTISDAAGNLILDSDTAYVGIADDLLITGNDIYDSETNQRINLGATTTLYNTTTTLSGTTTLTASSLTTMDTAASVSWDATSLTLGGNSTIYGSSGASGTLTLSSTSNATKGNLQFFDANNYITSSGNMVLAGTLSAASAKFQVDSNGDITKLKNLTYSWPSSHTASSFLKNDGNGNLTWSTDITATSMKWNALTDPDGNLSLTHNEYTTLFTWDTAATAGAFTGLTLALTNDATTDSNTQRILALQNNSATGGTTETLFYLNNADNNAITTAIEIGNTGGGGFTNFLETPSINISGTGAISGATGITSSGTITFSELTVNRLVATTTGGQLTTTSAGTVGQPLLSGGSSAPDWGTLGLVYGGTAADLSTVATGGLIYKTASALAGTSALSGILQGNDSSAPSAITGTANYLPKWASSTPYLTATSLIYDNGTNLGIGNNNPQALLHIGTGGTPDYAGSGDVYIQNNLEVDGTIYGTLDITDAVFDFIQVDRAATFSAQIASDIPITVKNTAGTEVARITNEGKLRLGSAGAPTDTLEVDGDADISGNLDVGNGLDVLGANFTVGGANFVVTQAGVVTGGTYNGQTISSSANFTGTLTIASTLTANGNTILGNESSDTITATAQFISSLIPQSTAYNLGSSDNRWGALYVDNIFGGEVGEFDFLQARGATLSAQIAEDKTLVLQGLSSGHTANLIEATANGANALILSKEGNLTLGGTLNLPNSNTLTGVASYVQFNNGVSVGGGTTYRFTSTGDAYINNVYTGGTQRLSSAGALSNITGYSQTTGNFSFTGTGSVTLGNNNGTVAIDSTSWDITSAGVASGLTQLTVDNLRLDGNTFSSTTGNITIDGAGTLIIADQIASSLIPSATNTYDLGSTEKYWDNAYINNLLANSLEFDFLTGRGATLSAEIATDKTLVLNAAADQTANLLEINSTVGADGDLMVVNASGNVGIGTTSPNYKLEVAGNTYINSRMGVTLAPQTDSYLVSGNSNFTETSGSHYGVNAWIRSNPASASSAYIYGSQGSIIVQAGNAQNHTNTLSGVRATFTHYGSGIVSKGRGITVRLVNDGGGTVSNLSGILIEDLYSTATISNTYGLYIGDLTTGTQTNTPYSIYASDGNTYNYFAGNVGIGTTGPEGKLHIMEVNGSPQIFVENTESSVARYPSIAITNYRGATAGHSYLGLFDAAGTKAAPATVGINASVGAVGWRAHTGTDFRELARIVVKTGPNFSDSDREGILTFMTGDGTGYTEKMRIDNTGNVGIGTTGPGYKLDVSGTGRFTDDLSLTGASSSYYGNSWISNAVSTGLSLFGTADTGFYTKSGGVLQFVTPVGGVAADVMTLNAGNVGIGTTGPGVRLEVGAAGSANEVVRVRSQNYSGIELLGDTDNDAGELGSGYVVVSQDNGAVQGIFSTVQSAGGDGRGGSYTDTLANSVLIGNTYASGALVLGAGNAVRMTIRENGNVGIGTTSPGSYKLNVAGNTFINGDITASKLIDADNNTYFIDPAGQDASVRGLRLAYGATLAELGGNVGIGTTGPEYKLDVQGGGFRVQNSGYFIFNGAADILFAYPPRGDGGRAIVADSNDTLTLNYAGDFAGGTKLGSNVFFAATTGNSYINTGNVGIGTTAPSQKLEVAGQIRATSWGSSNWTQSVTYTDETARWVRIASGNGRRSGLFSIQLSRSGRHETYYFYAAQSYNHVNKSSVVLLGSSQYGTQTLSKVRLVLYNSIGTSDPAYLEFYDTLGGSATYPATWTIWQIWGNWDMVSATDGSVPTGYTAYEYSFSDAVWTAGYSAASGNQAIYTRGGNFGIGTTSPGTKLHLDTGGSDAVLSIRMRNFVTGDGADQYSQINSGRISSGNSYLSFGTSYGGIYGEKVRIDNTGNVGIGTTSPATQVEIFKSASGTMGPILRLSNVGSAGGAVALDLANYQPTGSYDPPARISATDDGNYGSHINIMSKTPGAMANTLQSRIYVKSDGNVGIGTTGPGAKLHILGSSQNTLALDSPAYPELTLRVGGVIKSYDAIATTAGGYFGTSGVGDRIIRAEAGNILFGYGSSEKVRITTTGNVGIGTTGPNTRLSVSGGAINFIDANTTANANNQLRFGGNATDGSVTFVGTNNKDNASRLTLSSAGDGVFIGKYNWDANSHTNVGTIWLYGSNIILNAQADGTNEAVRADRTISASTGLSGGGNLTADRSFSVVYGSTAGTSAQGNVTLTGPGAGGGLTGGGGTIAVGAGGTFSTINVGAGTCITVNADDVAVTADCIGDTQLAYNTGQHLTTSSSPTFVRLTLTQATGTSPLAVTSTTVNTNLNADLWDGYHFADYLNQAVKTTSTPTFVSLNLNSTNNAFIELRETDSSGTPFIDFTNDNSTDYDARFILLGDDQLQLRYSRLGIWTASADYGIDLINEDSVNGRGRAYQWVTYSDISLKKDITPITDALDKIMALQGVYFTWRNSNTRSFGLIAQQVEPILPSIVSTDPQGIKSIDYSLLTALLIEGVKQQQTQIFSLSSQLEGLNLTDSGDLEITEVQSSKFKVQNKKTGEIITRIGAFAEIAAAKIKSGLIETENAVVNNLLAAKNIISEEKIISPVVETEEIQFQNQNAKIKMQNENAKLKIVDSEDKPTAEFDTETKKTSLFGDLLVKGEIKSEGDLQAQTVRSKTVESETITASEIQTDNLVAQEATFSTIYTDNIISKQGSFGDLLAEKISAFRGELEKLVVEKLSPTPDSPASNLIDQETPTGTSLFGQAENWSTAPASGSANLENLNIGDLGISGRLTAQETFVYQTLVVSSLALTENSLYSLDGVLKIQPSGTGRIEFLAGAMVIDEDGSITINGNLTVNGAIAANEFRGTNSDFNINLASETQPELATNGFGKLLVKGVEGETVFSVDEQGNLEASGSATFAKINLASAGNLIDHSPTATKITSNASAGEGIISPGQTEVIIQSEKITENSLVYITPTSDTQNQVVFVKQKTAGEFTVAINQPLEIEIRFNWWIIN